MYFEFIGTNFAIDTVTKQSQFLDSFKYTYNTFIYKDSTEGIFEPNQEILVQKDSIRTDDFCVRPNIDNVQEIEVKWKLVSEDFDESGSLFLEIHPEIIEKTTTEAYEHLLEDEIRFDNYNE